MDGATKIVKGDAVMSIIITVINFVAGIIIGSVQSNMTFFSGFAGLYNCDNR